jgi:hypothetical protein
MNCYNNVTDWVAEMTCLYFSEFWRLPDQDDSKTGFIWPSAVARAYNLSYLGVDAQEDGDLRLAR